jgi:hypothetical protein
MNMSGNRILRLVFSLSMLPTGAVFVLVASTSRLGTLVSGVGLSLIVAGIVSAFREVAILRLESEETAEDISNRLIDKLAQTLPQSANGLRMVSAVRRGYDGYYTWTLAQSPQELFFAGRSVLHRMDNDFHSRGLPAVEQILERKLREGSSVIVLFLDPRSALIPQLAREEAQEPAEMLADIAKSLGICERLYKLIVSKPLPPTARLHIRVYDEVPYFSYHRETADRDHDRMIVGFYFTSALGSASAAFEAQDQQTRNFFEGHFMWLYEHASDKGLLEVDGSRRGSPVFNQPLYDSLVAYLEEELGRDRCHQHLSSA